MKGPVCLFTVYPIYFNCNAMLIPLPVILATLLSGSSEEHEIGDVDLLFVLIPRYILAIYNII